MLVGDSTRHEFPLFKSARNNDKSSGVNDHPLNCPMLCNTRHRSIKIYT